MLTIENETDVNEIYSKAEYYSNSIEELDLCSLNEIKEIVSKHSSAFTEDELLALNSAIGHLKSSAETQIKILNFFKEVYIDDGSDMTDLLENAQSEHEIAKQQIEELETSLGL